MDARNIEVGSSKTFGTSCSEGCGHQIDSSYVSAQRAQSGPPLVQLLVSRQPGGANDLHCAEAQLNAEWITYAIVPSFAADKWVRL